MNPLLDALTRPPESASGLVVAYSGGCDSTTLLHALARHGPRGMPVRAVHVCHHLHAEAEACAEHCRARCAELGVGFTRLDVSVAESGYGLEAAARQARYTALKQAMTAGEALVTGHHARDQAETFILQALRGAGVEGLAAMPGLAGFGPGWHWRPWLAFDPAMIAAAAAQWSLSWTEDPTNADRRMDRNYLRHEVLPRLAVRWPGYAATLARSAGHAAAAASTVEACAEQDLAHAAEGMAIRCRRVVMLTAVRQRALIRRWLRRCNRDTPDHRHIEQIRALLGAELRASPCVRFAASEVRRHDDRLYAMPALADVPGNWRQCWAGESPLSLPGDGGRLDWCIPRPAGVVFEVRFRHGGERLDDGSGTRRRLKECLRAARIAPWVRDRMPLIYHRGRLVAVAGFWRDPCLDARLGQATGPIDWEHGLAG
ncbi:tRNA lysidine(34) synthetase TilS [Salinisphaera sp. T31B1]|uniref:tRNA lysidine(34) synthetase TilS n=1 Tax=Salinisphaera sp. T31B1 TaxID=727963 RepID=UPI0033419658